LEKRKCATCLTEKLVTNFYYNKVYKTHFAECKNCSKKRRRVNKLTKNYNTTEKEIKKLLKLQDNKCLICNCCIKKKYCIDHNNKTKIVRGLLCTKCNTGLGMLQDNPKILKAAISYLKNKGHYGS
jgi:hypothetical protein